MGRYEWAVVKLLTLLATGGLAYLAYTIWVTYRVM